MTTDYEARLTLVPKGPGETQPQQRTTTMSNTHDAGNQRTSSSSSSSSRETGMWIGGGIAFAALLVFIGYGMTQGWFTSSSDANPSQTAGKAPTQTEQQYETGVAPASKLISAAKQAKLFNDCSEQAEKRRQLGIPSQVTWDSPFKCRANGGWQEEGRLN